MSALGINIRPEKVTILANWNWGVQMNDDGSALLVFRSPSELNEIRVPMNSDTVARMRRDLMGIAKA